VTEKPPKIVELKKKRLVLKQLKEIRCSFNCSSRSRSTKIVEEDNQIYNTAGIEVKPDFQVVWINSTSMWEITIELLKKKVLEVKVYVTFVVEKMVH
jgi:protein TonB